MQRFLTEHPLRAGETAAEVVKYAVCVQIDRALLNAIQRRHFGPNLLTPALSILQGGQEGRQFPARRDCTGEAGDFRIEPGELDDRNFALASFQRTEGGFSVYQVKQTGIRSVSVAVTLAKQAQPRKR